MYTFDAFIYYLHCKMKEKFIEFWNPFSFSPT